MENGSARYCIVVADEAMAIFYGTGTRRGPLSELCTIENDVARRKTDQLISDKGGRSFDSFGRGRHTLQTEKTDPKRHASTMFAKDIVRRLSAQKRKGDCREFALIAAPRLLGLLRDELNTATIGEPFLTINKDIVGKSPDGIRQLVTRNL